VGGRQRGGEEDEVAQRSIGSLSEG